MNALDSFRLDGCVAFVSGAAGHLGRSMSRALAQAGARVILNGRDSDRLSVFERELRSEGLSVECAPFDMMDFAAVERFFSRCERLDILVNNAVTMTPKPFAEATPDDFATTYGSAVTAAFEAVRAARSALAAASAQRGDASVINIATMYAAVAPDSRIYNTPGQVSPPHYGAAKAGLVQLTRHLAAELGPYAVRVNAIAPGPFPRGELAQSDPDFVARLAAKTMLRRTAVAQEIQGPLLFLASRASSFVTGAVLSADGGGRLVSGVRLPAALKAADMSSFASFHTAKDFPEGLRERLRAFPILDDVGDAALRHLLAEADWFSLPGGRELMRYGDDDQAVFLVVTGSLGVFIEDERGARRLVAHIPAGEIVGEMSLLTGDPHSATLVALRDTELLRLGPESFKVLLNRYPHVMYNLLRTMAMRLRDTTRGESQKSKPKTFAVVPLQDGLQDNTLSRRVADALVGMGAKAEVLDVTKQEEPTDWFNRFEADHDVVFYQGDRPDSPWTNFCLRQADRVLLLARADRSVPLHAFERHFFKCDLAAAPELLLVHPPGMSQTLPEHIEFRRDLYGTHHHIREGASEDIKRLARFVAGRAVNVVLAGGGARGFAHIGVLRALKEANVPFDYVGGTSMGGIIAAGVAMEWDIDELIVRVKRAFVDTNPLSDFTFPLIALTRGAKVSRLLREQFGDVRIEDMAKPYFCVSADLTTGRDFVHRSGPVWRALRASVALPGILPPVVEGGHLLVDGGVMNNLPVDVMAEEARGPIIAVDVSGEIDLRARDPKYGERPIWSLVAQRMAGSPSLISILMRAGTVGSTAQRRIMRDQADFLFEPPLRGIGMGDWKSCDHAIAQGYAHAVVEIEKKGVPLSDTWTAGPALAIDHRSASV